MGLLDVDYSPYKCWLRQATKEDLISLAPRLRQADKDEFIANMGLPPELILPEAMLEGTCTGSVNEMSEVIMALGSHPVEGSDNTAVVWMVSSDDIFDYPSRFAAISKAAMEGLHQDHELLVNFIDARNTKHIQWLKWLGFKMVRRIDKFGPFSLPFIEFASYKCAYH